MRIRLPRGAHVAHAFRSLRHMNYRLFWFGQMVSLAGTWMQDVALSWLVLSLTDSPSALGLTMTIRFLPALLFSLYGGILADRLPKRKTILVCETTQLVVSLVLALLTSADLVTVALIYALAGVRGFVDAIEGPTRQAFVPEMVGTEDLANGVALNSTLFNGARIAGPALGAAVIFALGGGTQAIAACFYINTASFLAVIVALLAMRPRELYPVRRPPRGKVLAQLREGLHYARLTPEVMVILIVMGALGTFGYNFQTLLPLLAKYTLHAGASTLSLLMASLGAGSVVAGLIAAYRGKPSLRLLLGAAGCFIVLLTAVGFSKWPGLTAALLFFLGCAGILFMTSANSGLQLRVPDHLRGRVMGIYILLFVGTTPIGSFLTGQLAEHAAGGPRHAGVPTTIFCLAGLCAVGVITGAIYARRRIRPTGDEDRASSSPVEEPGA